MSLTSRNLMGSPQDIVDRINSNISEGGTFFNAARGPQSRMIMYEDIPPSYLKDEDGGFILDEDGNRIILEESGI